MKKILIVNNNMHIGGIQKALANLLCEVGGKYDITLLLFYKSGELKKDIGKNINIIYGNFFTRILGMTHAEAKKEGIFTFAWRSLWTLLTRVFKTKFTFNVLTKMQRLADEYDCAISFMQNGDEKVFYGGCAEFVLNSVKSKNRVCFVHCDFLNSGANTLYNRKTLEKFDKTAAVSNSVAKRLLLAAPQLKGRVFTVRNCFDYKKMAYLSEEYEPNYTEGTVNLFSAARLHEEKGILRMIHILKRIDDMNINFIWRIAGDGPEKNEALKLIDDLRLNGKVVLLGNLENPYPYFKKSDIVVVPSYNEAAPMVFEEAKAFGTLIFTTDTASAKEMVEDENCGFVCENEDSKIKTALAGVLKNYKPYKKTPEKADNSKAAAEFDRIVNI